MRGVCRWKVETIQEALSHALSQDQQTTAGKVMLMGLSTRAHFWVCFFLSLDEHAADDEHSRPPEKLHE